MARNFNILFFSSAVTWLCVLSQHTVSAQNSDTLNRQLAEVIIQGYLTRQPLAQVPASVAVLNVQDFRKTSQQSLLPALNTIPGIRMEERSPGSYRLSIRGSLLRSPFGIRNVKMYLNDLPFTDASGNAYLNLIDPAFLQSVEILKGPDGSLFGANSGGVVLMNTNESSSTKVQGSISGGSYGLFREHIIVGNAAEKFDWTLGQAFQRTDGYRQQSAMKRLNLVSTGKLKYGESNSLKATLLFSDLHYETPGGLTLEQYEDKPEQARLGAVEQKSGIYNTTLFGGLTNEFRVSPALRHVMSLFGAHTNYRNPFITNYETRSEENVGIRSYVEYSVEKESFTFKLYAGLENQWGKQNIKNYDNESGRKGDLQIEDDVSVLQHVYFSRATIDLSKRLTIEAAISLNQYEYIFDNSVTQKLSNEWMPRFAASFSILPEWSIRASAGRGYSPPTIAEIRPSGVVYNENLHAESGWNKEIGTRLSLWNGRLQADISHFWYNLNDAITRQTAPNDFEYFSNAGSTKQNGLEALLNTWIVQKKNQGIVRGLELKLSFTHNDFTFDDYSTSIGEFSGNRLTGVPRSIFITGISGEFPYRIAIFIQSNFTSHIPLNDGNTMYASAYELVQVRVGWTITESKPLMFEVYAGTDNLLNQQYSLGNDINAFGERYYNAAPLRNFYAGLNISF